MAKQRKKISNSTSDEILYLFDLTCCVCQDPNKKVQIHHIDENPVNNELENLAVLCLECHDAATKKGGFTKSLSPGLIKKYRHDWIDRVSRKRSISTVSHEDADISLPRIETFIDILSGDIDADDPVWNIDSEPEFAEINREDAILRKKSFYMAAQPFLDRGSTADCNHAAQIIVEGYKGLISELAQFYPEGHFGRDGPEEFLSRLIELLADWCFLSTTPTHGPMGTMYANDSAFRLCRMLDDIARDMLRTLSLHRLGEMEIVDDPSEWQIAWKEVEK